ncbi:MarR family winged helix-turn-helix transcriptional regulator [Geobacter anodireducens]|uniref:MarR family transcriptional regulator n=1 Tax=Geobacter anodireducens TaxID=1340425 RepID=A0ABR9NXA4_9BACT|nr:MarR family transcriptional regulator [Geobacter anodireducens]MBE2888896.1 MarR family transcriptional regulator [Geobacter anodireducens]
MPFSYDYNQSLGYLTGIASRLLNNTLATRFKAADIDMTPEQWGAIIILLNEGAMTQGQLGDQLLLEKSSVSRLADGLERRGWIERTIDPNDSRQRLVTPTQNALDMAECCATIARAIHEEVQRGMNEDEKLASRSLLARIIINLKEVSK